MEEIKVDSQVRLTVGVHDTLVQTSGVISREIHEHFSVFVSNYWFSKAYKNGNWDGKKKFYNRITRKLPTGLLPELIKWLNREGIPWEIVEKRFKCQSPSKVVTQLPEYDLESETYDYQASAVNLCLKKRRGVLRFATNAGKTVIAAALIESLQLNALFLCGSKDIMLQTADVFRRNLSLEVGCYGSGMKQLKPITVATVQSMSRLLRKNKKALTDFKVLFIDECHHGKSRTYVNVARHCPAVWRFGLSGTPFVGKYEHDWQLMAVTGPLLGTVSNQHLIDRGVSAKPTMHYIPSGGILEPSGDIKTYHDVVKHGIVLNYPRNRTILKTIKDCMNSGTEKILVLTPWFRHGKKLQRLFSKHLDCTVWFNSGGTPANIRHDTLKTFRKEGGVLIATTIYDEGVDAPEVETLILAASGYSKRQLLQRIGRALRKKPGDNTVAIYDFIDTHHKYLSRHSLLRAAYCLKEGFEVKGPKEFIEKAKQSAGVQKRKGGSAGHGAA